MANTIRQYLLDELGMSESKNLSNVSKYIRMHTKLEDEDKCACCVCGVRSKQLYPRDKNAEQIYNHHVMKVEYLAILADRYHMCYTTKDKSKIDRLKVNDYRYYPGYEPYSPRVAVCDIHHTMFHELVGDNELEKIKNINIFEAENIVDVFEEFNDDVRLNCEIKKDNTEDMKGYKNTYQGIWDETLIKSLTRLSYIIKINEIKYQSEDYKELYRYENFDEYEKLLDRIDNIIYETLDYDNEGNIIVPDIAIFSLNELEEFERELKSLKLSNEETEMAFDYLNKKPRHNKNIVEEDIAKVIVDMDLELDDFDLDDIDEIVNTIKQDESNNIEDENEA